ncbi:hypothetical protein EB169_10360 [archaeon]|nr:hypothetical protein [archaeon]
MYRFRSEQRLEKNTVDQKKEIGFFQKKIFQAKKIAKFIYYIYFICKINCNSEGNYIVFDTTNFPKNRVYRLLFLIERNGFEDYFEDDLTFEIRSNGVRVD